MYKIVLFSQGAHAITSLQYLFANGIKVDNIAVITLENSNNEVFRNFLKFNGMKYHYYTNHQLASDYVLSKLDYVDLILSIANPIILKEEILRIPKYGSINLHPGLLPDYKGSFCIPWALINKEHYVGYTYHFVTNKVDAGNILLKDKIAIMEKDTAHTLHYKVMLEGISKLYSVIEDVIVNQNKGIKQETSGKFYFNKLPHDGIINKNWSLDEVNTFIKAMYFPPYRDVKVEVDGKMVYVDNIEEYRNITKEK